LFGSNLGRSFPPGNLQGFLVIFFRLSSFLANIVDHPQTNKSPGPYPSVIGSVVLEGSVQITIGPGIFPLVQVYLSHELKVARPEFGTEVRSAGLDSVFDFSGQGESLLESAQF
jgi:hypothetical protein